MNTGKPANGTLLAEGLHGIKHASAQHGQHVQGHTACRVYEQGTGTHIGTSGSDPAKQAGIEAMCHLFQHLVAHAQDVERGFRSDILQTAYRLAAQLSGQGGCTLFGTAEDLHHPMATLLKGHTQPGGQIAGPDADYFHSVTLSHKRRSSLKGLRSMPFCPKATILSTRRWAGSCRISRTTSSAGVPSALWRSRT